MSSTTLDNVEQASGKGRTDENFPVGSFLIRPALRPHVHAFYAFARNADDIADSPTLPPAEKLARLETMEAVLLLGPRASCPPLLPSSLPSSPPNSNPTRSPTAQALRKSLATTKVTPQHAQDLLAAFRQDATKTRYATWSELLDYCRLSAMPVGRHVLDLHGESLATHAPSDALCAVLQVLNHLQDGQKDLAALDRCYLPQDELAAAGAATHDLEASRATPGLRTVLDSLLTRCDALMAEAAALPGLVQDRRLRLECAVIVGLANRLSRRLRREDPVAGRVKLLKRDVAAALLAALRYVR